MGVIFQDESHFELNYLVRRLWSPDPRPVVRLNYQKSERLTVFGGLDLDDGRLTLAAGAAGAVRRGVHSDGRGRGTGTVDRAAERGEA